MRIAQVCPRYYPALGGVQRYVSEVTARMAKRGYDIEIITTDPTGKLSKEGALDGIPLRRFDSWAPNEAFYFSSDLKRYLARNSGSYDLVHAHSYHAFPALYAALGKSSNKLVFTPHFHGTGHSFLRRLLHVPYRLVAKKIFESADQIICVSKFERKLITSFFKIPGSKISVIPNGVNLNEYKTLESETPRSRSVLYVGRLEKYKRIDCLLKALKYLDNDICLEIVGKGPAKERLHRLVCRLHLGERVTFSESLSREDLLEKYKSAGVFATLSEYEAYGLTVAEALAAGTPCVVANSSALKEWVDRGLCLGAEHPTDAPEVASLIRNAIGMRIERVKLMDWDEVSESIARIYEGLVQPFISESSE